MTLDAHVWLQRRTGRLMVGWAQLGMLPSSELEVRSVALVGGGPETRLGKMFPTRGRAM